MENQKMSAKRRREKGFYGKGIPGIRLDSFKGMLIVIEGPDGSGRSTQVELVKSWLESKGHAIVDVGIKRSNLVSKQLNRILEGNILNPITRSLFYATDFADQLENIILPALKAGFMVLADRYIYTLMARDIVRGGDRQWVESVYGMAVVPDAVFYLKTNPKQLVERNFMKNPTLNYWEAGMDIGLSRDMFDSFVRYQKLMQAEFMRMHSIYGFNIVDANRSARKVFMELQAKIEDLLPG